MRTYLAPNVSCNRSMSTLLPALRAPRLIIHRPVVEAYC
eukprot:COSAG01_NODE_60308_length_295_cov_1.285714_1_plen_38_part_01